jgi:hypothetical protein
MDFQQKERNNLREERGERREERGERTRESYNEEKIEIEE